MFIGLFDCQSMVHYDFIPRGQTMNLEFLVIYGFLRRSSKQTTGTLATTRPVSSL